MSTLNQVIIEGNIVRDVSVKEKPWGTKFCVASIAVNHYYKDKQGNFADEVGYYDVHVFGENSVKSLEKIGKKGVPIRVIGRLKQDRWKNSDGKQTSRNYIVAAHIDYLKKQIAEKKDNEKSKETQNLLADAMNGVLRKIDDIEDSITINEEDAAF